MSPLVASDIALKYSLGEIPHSPQALPILGVAAFELLTATGSAALGFVGTAAGLGGLSGTVTIFGLSVAESAILATAVVVGATIGVSMLVSPKQSRKLDAPDITIKQPLPGRFIDIGRVKTAGCIFFEDRGQAGLSPTFVVGTILSCCTIGGFDGIFFGDFLALDALHIPADQVPVPVFTGAPWTGKVTVEIGHGRLSETAPTILFNQFPSIGSFPLYNDGSGNPNPVYANKGLAYAVVSYTQGANQTDQTNSFPQGAPPVAAVIRGAGLPDPNNPAHDLNDPTTWTYSDNSALAVLRYCLDVDGWGLKPDDLDLNSFVAAAAICNEDMGAAEAHQARYSSWGRYWATNERASTLRELLMACDGRLIEQGNGKAALYVGRLTADDVAHLVTIRTEDILEATFNPFGDTLDRVGAVKPRFVDETNNWQETEGEQVELANPDADQAIKVEDLAIQFCPRVAQARRLAKARLRALNPDWRCSLTTRLVGMQAFGDRFVNVDFRPPGGISVVGTFEIIGGLALNLEGGVPTSVSMQLASVRTDNWETPS